MSVNYQVLPNVKRKFRVFTLGSVVGALLWVLVTWSFTLYAEHFGNYNATYGSIGGVVVLMTWLYLTGLIFLIGGKLNALIANASEKRPGVLSPTVQTSAAQG